MKKSLSMISSALLLSAMLAACNTDTEKATNTSVNEQTETESAETDTTTVEETTTTNEQAEQQPTENNSTEQSTLTFTSNGVEKTENAIVSTSDELGYSITHLENYTLESEEPGVDLLINNEDSALSMRISVANTEDVSFDDVKASTIQTIEAVATEKDYSEIDLSEVKAATSDIQNIIGYETFYNSEKVTMITFEKGAKIVTLSIYDTKEADLTDAFLKMGLTIQ